MAPKILVDTSVYYALADGDDRYHAAAQRLYAELLESDSSLCTTSYVVAEAAALIQARLGLERLQLFRQSLAASTTIVWIDAALHEAAWDELERQAQRHLSLVDCSIGIVAQQRGIDRVFAFDPHFELWGLQLVKAV